MKCYWCNQQASYVEKCSDHGSIYLLCQQHSATHVGSCFGNPSSIRSIDHPDAKPWIAALIAANLQEPYDDIPF